MRGDRNQNKHHFVSIMVPVQYRSLIWNQMMCFTVHVDVEEVEPQNT